MHPGAPRINSNACGAACPKGYFVKTVYTTDLEAEKCQLHKTCSQDESVILAGSSWHDTICGRPADFPRIESLVNPPAVKTLEVLDRLAALWMPTLPDDEFLQVCKHFSPSTPPPKSAAGSTSTACSPLNGQPLTSCITLCTRCFCTTAPRGCIPR